MSSPSTRRRRPKVAAVLLASLLGLGGVPAALTGTIGAKAADPSADIPGVPLPGPVAAGRLGGSIYDVVYNFSVPPGYVIVASLSGATGTDFDLYLFDASATTVLSSTGLLTKSIGPTSSESISWPSRFGGTYYIDMNGASNVEGDYRLTVQTIPDPTPPVAGLVLAGGRTSTNQLTVPVTVTATDDLSGVAEMALSSDGVTYGAWQPFQRSTTWQFPPGDGRRGLWVIVKNGVGLESAPARADVTIDTVPPSVIAFDPTPGSSVIGLRPQFALTFSEPMDAATWNDLGLIVQSPTGPLVPGAYAYDVHADVGSFVPSLPLQPGLPYIVNVGDVKDLAGNRVSFLGSWSITPIAPTALIAAANPRVVLRGGSARLDVSLTGAPLPTSIDVLSSTSASPAFVSLASVPSQVGHGSLAVAPSLNTTYRFTYPGAFGVAPAQVDVRVLVRRSITLAGRNSAVVSRVGVGSSVKLTAAIGPAVGGVSLSFRLYRFDVARRVWIYAGSRGRTTDAAGHAALFWAPSQPGSYYWRAWVASTAEFANNVSPVYRWTVNR